MHPILTKNASIQGILRLQTHDSLVGIELKSLGGTFSIEAFLRFQGKIVKSYRVLCRVIVCRVGAIVCIVSFLPLPLISRFPSYMSKKAIDK